MTKTEHANSDMLSTPNPTFTKQSMPSIPPFNLRRDFGILSLASRQSFWPRRNQEVILFLQQEKDCIKRRVTCRFIPCIGLCQYKRPQGKWDVLRQETLPNNILVEMKRRVSTNTIAVTRTTETHVKVLRFTCA